MCGGTDIAVCCSVSAGRSPGKLCAGLVVMLTLVEYVYNGRGVVIGK